LRFRAVGRARPRSASAAPRLLVALVAAAALLGAPITTPSARAAGLTWIDGDPQTSTVTNCASSTTDHTFTETGAAVTTGFQADVANASPRAGIIYYVRVHIDGLGSPCGGQHAVVDLLLPPNTSTAISVANPITCFASKGVSWTQQFASCPTSLGASATTPGALSVKTAAGRASC